MKNLKEWYWEYWKKRYL